MNPKFVELKKRFGPATPHVWFQDLIDSNEASLTQNQMFPTIQAIPNLEQGTTRPHESRHPIIGMVPDPIGVRRDQSNTVLNDTEKVKMWIATRDQKLDLAS